MALSHILHGIVAPRGHMENGLLGIAMKSKTWTITSSRRTKFGPKYNFGPPATVFAQLLLDFLCVLVTVAR